LVVNLFGLATGFALFFWFHLSKGLRFPVHLPPLAECVPTIDWPLFTRPGTETAQILLSK